MADFRRVGKDDPEPWKPDEVEYALYDDIDRTKIKGYAHDDEEESDEESDEETPTPTESDTDEDGTSSVTSSTTSNPTIIKNMRRRKPRWTATTPSSVQYANILQEDNDFVPE